MEFAFGQTERERIVIDVISYEQPVANDIDYSWIIAIIPVTVGNFHGNAEAHLTTGELIHFSDQLKRLYDQLTGSAVFSTLEGQLSLKLVGDGLGHIHLDGSVMDRAGVGNELLFKLDFDQTILAQSIRDLGAVIRRFPVRDGHR